MRRATLTILILAALAAPALAEQAPAAPPASAPARPEEAARSGRYAFFPAAVQGGLEYLLDTATGDLWVLSRDADTNYFYLGYIPRAPQFPFAEILRQKQLRQQAPGAAPSR
ncbi:MAG: hypothetical protein ACREKF_02490 [Candidatus Methylomirabilales bacterium]